MGRLLGVLVATLAGCGPGTPPADDAGRSDAIDAGTAMLDAGTTTLDAGTTTFDGGCTGDGCACEEEAAGECTGFGEGRYCCDGTWWMFLDGPCSPEPDGGVPACESGPREGCACATEGEVGCPVDGWRHVCSGGVWVEQHGRFCC